MSEQKKNLLERLETLEQSFGNLAQTATLAKNLRDAFGVVVETLDALIEEMGGKDLSDRLTARLAAKREAQKQARNERAKAVIEQLVKNNQLEAVAAVDATTVIIGTESNSTGAIVDEYVQTAFSNLVPEAQAKILGQGVGFVLEHNESKLTITGLYRMKAQTDAPAALTETPAATPAESTPAAAQTTETAPETPAATSAETSTETPA